MGHGIAVRVGAWMLACVALGLLACGPAEGVAPCETSCLGADCPESACAPSAAGESEAPRPASTCEELPSGGRCLGARVLERCVDGAVHREDCGTEESCVEEDGARCAPGMGCLEGVSRCTEALTLEVCTGGSWREATCAAGCVATPGRGWCGDPGPTRSGWVRYARRWPDAAFRAWTQEAELVAARGFLVVSYRGSTLLDAQVTDEEGLFTLKVSAEPGEDDTVVVYAAGRGRGGAVSYAVADPGLTGSQRVPATPGKDARIWSWVRDTRELATHPVVTIREEEGAGAAAVFDMLGTAWRRSRERYYGREGLSVVAWLGFGTTWSCGACFARAQVTAVGRRWESQVWLPGDSDAAWWSDAMVTHELGHWVMASHGTSPEEGGAHFVGVPTFPGQAWSEGWATWFSSDVRGSSRYYDRQDGTMFWMDLSARTSTVSAWPRPRPEDGLLQRMDENEVAAILYRAALGTPSSQPLYDALASPAMNRAPWPRGYQRHTWKLGEDGSLLDAVDTGVAAPCLADFLDALMCRDFPRTVVDAATEPTTAFPYPSHAPLCP